MVYKIVTVFDVKSESYELPQYVRASGEAIRHFQTLVNDGKSVFSKHPDDFLLYEIGEFDERSGTIDIRSLPLLLGSGDTFVDSSDSTS